MPAVIHWEKERIGGMRMMLAEQLEIGGGITAVIGGGGKTTFLRTLGAELAAAGKRVILTTTTKIYPFPDIPVVTGGTAAVSEALREHSLLCVGMPTAREKLAHPAVSMETLAALADYVLVEADGSAGCPMKAHAPHEPVIPPGAERTVFLLGASGFYRPIREAAHRPERYALLAACREEDAVTPERAAAVLLAEGLGDCVLINQAETAERLQAAADLAQRLSVPVYAGSLQRGEIVCVS